MVAAPAAAVFAVFFTANTGPQAASAINWVNQPVAIPATRAPHNPGIPNCTQPALTVRLERRGLIGTGVYAYLYQARNKSAHACYLSGRPNVRAAGQAVPRAADVLNVEAGVLAPGATATFAIIQTPHLPCPAVARARPPARAMQAQVAIGAQPSQGASTETIFTSACTRLAVTPIGLPPTTPKPGPLAALNIRLYLPTTARAGQSLHFTVVITNPTAEPIRLSPCPDYETGISSAPAVAYKLNCPAAIPAQRSLMFGMQYRVPAGTPSGVAKIGWFLLNPDRSGAGSAIRIIG
jgi:Protein of unknown function (DUF4232)